MMKKVGQRFHLRNERNPGGLEFIRDEILPCFIGIIMNHQKDPYQPTIIMEIRMFFFLAHLMNKITIIASGMFQQSPVGDGPKSSDVRPQKERFRTKD